MARLLPEDRIFGILAEDLISVLAVILVFLIAGLFVGTRPGRRLSDRLERSVLYRVPGYLLVRGAVGRFPGLNSEMPPEPALVETDSPVEGLPPLTLQIRIPRLAVEVSHRLQEAIAEGGI